MASSSPILDLEGLTLEVNHLPRAARFYHQVLGLEIVRLDETAGVAEFRVNTYQTLRCWMPLTRRSSDARLGRLGARGASHLHYAWQIPLGQLEAAKATLDAHGISWREIDLGNPEQPDPTVYFFDPFGHGLELRMVRLDPHDPRAPHFPPRLEARPPFALPVVGLREVALAFTNYAAMKERLPRAFGFACAKEQPERNFAQFTLGPGPEEDGKFTPRRWLYAWDPQVGLADMLGGEHACVRFYADVDEVQRLTLAAGLESLRDDHSLAVRDPEGHVFEFIAALAR
ncbi:catechol 2,3-dioxygenase-like lactoylglutathione lyase family enzyme [Deinobacterium chartae]|uniref:Catechol 2,3-dioxygenase-like lactoylglutathione lyase family enzyme n=1 Tax=Deinobacterium chartae TaxID=521158 RepID=A0A841I180_9DEIO|nr:VOC family protein [Deinobacterium chartae]MBB6098159.1 catechol 2,3-dioxygenase-like lactoylglutathione lyase family enzyme [Deinobacterium chartae]